MLAAIYTAFSEGWSDAAGTDSSRRDLTSEAFFLARLVTDMLPGEPEAIGLLALMLHAEARRGARRSEEGEYVPLAKQDPLRWDAPMIDEAEALLVRASAFGVTGRYQLEAAVQSAHVYRCRTGQAIGKRCCKSTMRSSPSPDHRWWRSIARWLWRNCTMRMQDLRQCPIIAAMAGLPNTSPTGRRGRSFSRRRVRTRRLGQAYEIAIGLERDPAVRRFLEAAPLGSVIAEYEMKRLVSIPGAICENRAPA